ncbi:MAG TPA: helix-turn-helix domain-containing protein [Gemmatimonadales bacterium]|nr:helix-turn-helix domain-containing protein [Gemmatimonadales bacterium]
MTKKSTRKPHPASSPSRDVATEERILEAARTVFIRRGTAGARMREIAQEAGVNQALLHYYFRSKANLAEAVFQQAARRLFPPVIALLGSDASLDEKVERVVEHELRVLLANPFLPGYVLAELNQDPDRARQLVEAMMGTRVEGFAPQVFAKLAAQIAERVAAGTMRPITADQFAMNLISLCVFPFAARPMFCALLQLDADGFAGMIQRRKETLVSFFLGALRP